MKAAPIFAALLLLCPISAIADQSRNDRHWVVVTPGPFVRPLTAARTKYEYLRWGEAKKQWWKREQARKEKDCSSGDRSPYSFYRHPGYSYDSHRHR